MDTQRDRQTQRHGRVRLCEYMCMCNDQKSVLVVIPQAISLSFF